MWAGTSRRGDTTPFTSRALPLRPTASLPPKMADMLEAMVSLAVRSPARRVTIFTCYPDSASAKRENSSARRTHYFFRNLNRAELHKTAPLLASAPRPRVATAPHVTCRGACCSTHRHLSARLQAAVRMPLQGALSRFSLQPRYGWQLVDGQSSMVGGGKYVANRLAQQEARGHRRRPTGNAAGQPLRYNSHRARGNPFQNLAMGAERRAPAVTDVSRGDLQRCSVGRLELVQWVNSLLQLDYPQACPVCFIASGEKSGPVWLPGLSTPQRPRNGRARKKRAGCLVWVRVFCVIGAIIGHGALLVRRNSERPRASFDFLGPDNTSE